ncbi:MAG TPA: DNA polymerase III subunit epsilon, partial [Azospirillaceae bacterium]|nr:DNA polymerase III subunit epsilon [Azospirillaceae bacterium]
MAREIVLDTETTGLNPLTGDRVVEIGCVELINHLPTGSHFHKYINPECPVPAEAFAVHGLSDDFLRDKPVFAEIAGDFLDFVADGTLVIHNASFDLGFLNAELARLGLPAIPMARAIDTVKLARQKIPGAQVNLDALCRRFGIDNSNRTLHGALLDSQLLAEVYLELLGGRQRGLSLSASEAERRAAARIQRVARPPRPHAASPEELAAHEELLKKLKNPLWLASEAT